MMTDEELDKAAPKIELPQALPHQLPPIEGALLWRVGGNEFRKLIFDGISRAMAPTPGEAPHVPAAQTIAAEQAHPFMRDGVTPQRPPAGLDPATARARLAAGPQEPPPHDPAAVPKIAPPEALAATRTTPATTPPARTPMRTPRFQEAPARRGPPSKRR
jgi:hypothetical protein